MAKKKQAVKVTRTGSVDTPSREGSLVGEIEDAFLRVLENWPMFGRRWHASDFDPFDKLGVPSRFAKGLHMPRVDMAETEAGYELTAEMPGLSEKDVECTLSGNVLTVKGEKLEEKEKKKKGYHLQERRYGSFERSLTIPDDVDVDKLQATVSRGVLTVVLPRDRQSKTARKIDVKGE